MTTKYKGERIQEPQMFKPQDNGVWEQIGIIYKDAIPLEMYKEEQLNLYRSSKPSNLPRKIKVARVHGLPSLE